MFFMLSVPSPAARTSCLNITAIASAPSAITATTMTRTRLPPESSTTAGVIPVICVLLGISRLEPGGVYAGGGVPLHPVWPSPRGRPGRGSATGSARGERGLGRLVDHEHLRQAGDAEDLEEPVLVAHQVERALVGAHLLQAADQDAEAGRVEELDVLHVDDDVVGAGGDELGELVPQARSRVDVDLSPDGDDGRAVGLVGRKSQVHVFSTALVCAPVRARARRGGPAPQSNHAVASFVEIVGSPRDGRGESPRTGPATDV